MFIIICYDVSTDTPEGRKRLRRVAKVCESAGQRVQKSVFECRLDQMRYEALERRLLSEIDQEEDSLRIYRLNEPTGSYIREFGNFRSIDFEGPLII
jgi:CRISPR-associated protein Cas2